LPTIGLVVGASVVIGTLIYYFAFRGRWRRNYLNNSSCFD
jgi:membrane associated rhomboid family serine protease